MAAVATIKTAVTFPSNILVALTAGAFAVAVASADTAIILELELNTGATIAAVASALTAVTLCETVIDGTFA